MGAVGQGGDRVAVDLRAVVYSISGRYWDAAELMPANMRATACAILLFTANAANLILARYHRLAERLVAASFGAGSESLRWRCAARAYRLLGRVHLWTSGATIARTRRAQAERGPVSTRP